MLARDPNRVCKNCHQPIAGTKHFQNRPIAWTGEGLYYCYNHQCPHEVQWVQATTIADVTYYARLGCEIVFVEEEDTWDSSYQASLY